MNVYQIYYCLDVLNIKPLQMFIIMLVMERNLDKTWLGL